MDNDILIAFDNQRLKARAGAIFVETFDGFHCKRCAPILRRYFFNGKKALDPKNQKIWENLNRYGWKWKKIEKS